MFPGGSVPTPTSVADLLATTLDTYSPTMTDNIFTKHRLLNAIKKSDGLIGIDGGENYDIPLEYGEGTMETFGRTTALSQDTPNTMMTYKVLMKNAAVPCKIYKVDEWINQGAKNKRKDYVKSKINNIEKSIRKGMETMMWTAGAGALDFLGIPDIVDPSTTIEGMNPTTYAWWASQSRTLVGDFETNGMEELTAGITLVNEAAPDGEDDSLDVIGGNSSFWNAYIAKAEQKQYLVNTNKPDLGFSKGPTKDGIPVTLFSNAPAGEIYGLNFKYLKLVYHKSVNFDLTDWEPIGGGVQGKVRWVVFRGATCTTNRRSQVKWTGVTY